MFYFKIFWYTRVKSSWEAGLFGENEIDGLTGGGGTSKDWIIKSLGLVTPPKPKIRQSSSDIFFTISNTSDALHSYSLSISPSFFT